MTEWTKTPPSECGYYWMRLDTGSVQIVSGYGAECWMGEGWTAPAHGATLAAEGYEWWPKPIEPPPTVRGKSR